MLSYQQNYFNPCVELTRELWERVASDPSLQETVQRDRPQLYGHLYPIGQRRCLRCAEEEAAIGDVLLHVRTEQRP